MTALGDRGAADDIPPSMTVPGPAHHLCDRSVSVVIATRDRPALVRRAIEAVAAQRHDDAVEIVVVHDRSEVDRELERSAACADGAVPIVVTDNTRSPGLAGARNTGIAAASNAWIAFCDDDDEWLPGKLQAQFDALAALPAARAACTGILIRYDGVDTPRVPRQDRLSFEGFLRDRMTEVHPSSWLIESDTLRNEVGPVDEELPGGYGEDYDLMLRTARLGPIAVAPQPLVRVWWHGGSFYFERWQMIDEALDHLLGKHPEFATERAGLARIRGQQAVARAASGRRGAALRTALATARLRPIERRWPLAVAVAAGLPAETALRWAHRRGRGI